MFIQNERVLFRASTETNAHTAHNTARAKQSLRLCGNIRKDYWLIHGYCNEGKAKRCVYSTLEGIVH